MVGIRERGTLRSSVLKELKFNLNLQMDEHGKSALTVLEICHVTRRMAGDSPSVISQHKLTVSLPFSKFS